MPSFRSCSVGPPPSAIHGRGRLTRHPCRVAHCAEPPLGLTRGRPPPQHREAACGPTWFFRYMHSPVGAGLPAMVVNDDVCCLKERGVWTSIAGKPAPTGFWVHPQKQIVSHRVPGTSARAGRLRGRLREQARSHSGLLAGMTLVFSPMILTDFRPAIRPPRFVFDLDLPRRKAERRFCAVGNPAWMPG
ncbi:hypothetical protein J2Y86_005757 [Pseudomonas migulae]|nr:hypothetical protein [Pseudomonas migulae]